MSQPPVKKEPQPETPIKQEWQEIPLKAGTADDLTDTRYHIMKFISKQDVNIIDNFTKPVRLHRKDPRNIQFHLTRRELDIRKRENEQAKREKLEQEQAAREGGEDDVKVENGADLVAPEPAASVVPNALSQVAPDGGARKQKKNLFKRKTRQINLMDDAKRKLRYEEHYPWVIEDYDGDNVFVGNYEAGASESQHVLFVFDKDGFKMIPAEKVYRFTPRNKYATLTLEEAEAKMEKNATVPRWLMKHMEDRSNLDNTPDQRFRNAPANGTFNRSAAAIAPSSTSRRLRTVIGGSNGNSRSNRESNERDSDHDDLDYDEEFADDEEAPIMDGDEEENKLSERKIKKEMLKAAHFDGKSDVEGDLDDLDDLFETEKTRKVDKEGKKLRKVLNKREGGVYDDDDEDEEGLLPYLSKSDLESNEESEDEEEVDIKKESDVKVEDQPQQQHYQRTIYVDNIESGFVTIKAPASFLSTLPKGEWNPHVARKRQTPELITSPSKKMKLDNESVSPIPIASTRSPSPPITKSPSPVPTTGVDLNSSGPDNVLVTINDVLDIVRNNPLTTKELLVGLKSRVSAHKDNKQRIITIVKQNLKLVDGKLVLKE
ncbi:Transcription initiation factor IIF subunit alpha [Spathaspora sp. JA1]|nr:Transcription initiation factor IIF subunit alpha [Spathaspora sp. JA1]